MQREGSRVRRFFAWGCWTNRISAILAVLLLLLSAFAYGAPRTGHAIDSTAGAPWPMFRHDPRHNNTFEKNDGGWGQYGHDAQHTWRYDYSKPVGDPVMLRKKEINAIEILVYQDYLFVSTLSSVLILDANTFEEVRRFDFGYYVHDIAVYNGVLYVRNNNDLSAYSIDGEMLWNVSNVSGFIQVSEEGIFLWSFDGIYWISFLGIVEMFWTINYISAPPSAFDGKLYVPVYKTVGNNSLQASIYVINLKEDGTANISLFGKDEMIKNIAVGSDGTIYVYTCNCNRSEGNYVKIYALDQRGHKKWIYLWNHNISAAISDRSITLIGNKYLYAAICSDGKLAVIQLNKPDGRFGGVMAFNVTRYGGAFVDSADNFYLAAENTIYSYSSNLSLNWKINIKGKINFGSFFYTKMVPYSQHIFVVAYDEDANKTFLYKVGPAHKDETQKWMIYCGVAVIVVIILVILWKTRKNLKSNGIVRKD